MQFVIPQYKEILTQILQLMRLFVCAWVYVSVWDSQHTGRSLNIR
jgi:hypothetical protein